MLIFFYYLNEKKPTSGNLHDMFSCLHDTGIFFPFIDSCAYSSVDVMLCSLSQIMKLLLSLKKQLQEVNWKSLKSGI